MKKILISDDSKSMRAMISATLIAAKFSVDEAEDGLIALDMLKKSNYDLLLTDVNMPNMNGLELVKNVRQFNKNIPILVLTTESSDNMKSIGKVNGATGWIVKPFSPEKLIQVIQRVL